MEYPEKVAYVLESLRQDKCVYTKMINEDAINFVEYIPKDRCFTYRTINNITCKIIKSSAFPIARGYLIMLFDREEIFISQEEFLIASLN